MVEFLSYFKILNAQGSFVINITGYRSHSLYVKGRIFSALQIISFIF